MVRPHYFLPKACSWVRLGLRTFLNKKGKIGNPPKFVAIIASYRFHFILIRRRLKHNCVCSPDFHARMDSIKNENWCHIRFLLLKFYIS